MQQAEQTAEHEAPPTEVTPAETTTLHAEQSAETTHGTVVERAPTT
ncbi:hypothetical protein V2I01_12490 [Micromonospora sp. BRA006-A]|nr:hypothetical protein [Micromonospora sp. BRA006-A]